MELIKEGKKAHENEDNYIRFLSSCLSNQFRIRIESDSNQFRTSEVKEPYRTIYNQFRTNLEYDRVRNF